MKLQEIRNSDKKALTAHLLEKQNHLCLLCGKSLEISALLDNKSNQRAVLDHNHETGQIRGVLHNGCNVFEGRVQILMQRCSITGDAINTVFKNLPDYLKASSGTQYRYPEKRKPAK